MKDVLAREGRVIDRHGELAPWDKKTSGHRMDPCGGRTLRHNRQLVTVTYTGT